MQAHIIDIPLINTVEISRNKKAEFKNRLTDIAEGDILDNRTLISGWAALPDHIPGAVVCSGSYTDRRAIVAVVEHIVESKDGVGMAAHVEGRGDDTGRGIGRQVVQELQFGG